MTEWKPTPKQKDILLAAQEAGLKRSIAAVCRDAGVSRQSFYKWLDIDPDFRQAWEDAWHGTVKRHMPGAVAAMVARAQEGDVPAARLLAELAGQIVKRTQVSGPDGGPISFTQIMEWAEEQAEKDDENTQENTPD